MMVSELVTRIKKSPNILVTNYMGLSSIEVNGLRKDLKKSESTYVIVKNSVIKRALNETSLKEIADLIDGGVGIGFTGEDPVPAAKILADLAKVNNKFILRGAYLFGSIVTKERLGEIAALPSREALLARALSGMKSPITGFVGALGGIIRKLVWCVDAIKKSKESDSQ
ncbi:MAG: 50S ribosomal protein L10 [Candidatus Omnitrophota bacterium]